MGNKGLKRGEKEREINDPISLSPSRSGYYQSSRKEKRRLLFGELVLAYAGTY